MSKKLAMLSFISASVFSSLLCADAHQDTADTIIETQSLSATVNDLYSKLAYAFPGVAIRSVNPSPLVGLFEVETEKNGYLYSNHDASYFLEGSLYSIENDQISNVTDAKKAVRRLADLNQMPAETLISYPATGESRSTISVFTDVDCGYCRKFHREVPALNAMGITVNYYAFPRAGQGSVTYKKMESAWCADDPQKALTDVKEGREILAKRCENLIMDQYQLGQNLGVTGTPSIVLDSGQVVPGYVPAAKLQQVLNLEPKVATR